MSTCVGRARREKKRSTPLQIKWNVLFRLKRKNAPFYTLSFRGSTKKKRKKSHRIDTQTIRLCRNEWMRARRSKKKKQKMWMNEWANKRTNVENEKSNELTLRHIHQNVWWIIIDGILQWSVRSLRYTLWMFWLFIQFPMLISINIYISDRLSLSHASLNYGTHLHMCSRLISTTFRE